MYCIETKNLFHAFPGNDIAVNNINLQIAEGSIYGFLGPNGAGKTTTLKLILGLLEKQQGEIIIFGKTLEKNRIDILKHIGSLIETPSLYGHLTAIENLNLLQKIHQCNPSRIRQVLNLVGLSNSAHKKTSQFSIGMKQRLSIAIALLHHPSLLILDEPTNGLDPNGMIEIRELLLKLNQEEGITILISSHLLSEIEKLVNYVGVIDKGKMLFQGTLETLKNKQNESLHIILETNNLNKTLEIVNNLPLKAAVHDGKIILPPIPKPMIAALTRQLIKQDVDIYEISVVKNDLETIFMNLVSN